MPPSSLRGTSRRAEAVGRHGDLRRAGRARRRSSSSGVNLRAAMVVDVRRRGHGQRSVAACRRSTSSAATMRSSTRLRSTRRTARESTRVNPEALREITGLTGGYTEVVRSAADLGPATARIADELNKQYTIGYSSSKPPDGSWRPLRVRVRTAAISCAPAAATSPSPPAEPFPLDDSIWSDIHWPPDCETQSQSRINRARSWRTRFSRRIDETAHSHLLASPHCRCHGRLIVILVMSVTGVLLTYERQLIAWSDSQYRSTVPAPGAQPAVRRDAAGDDPARSILTSTPTAVTVGSAARCAGHRRRAGSATLYVDAYSGALLGEGTQGMRRFMSETRAWHRWLAVEGEGTARSPAPSPAGPTSSSSSSSSRASISGSRASGPGSTSAPSCCSAAGHAARRATSTGTTSSASGRRCRSSSSC